MNKIKCSAALPSDLILRHQRGAEQSRTTPLYPAAPLSAARGTAGSCPAFHPAGPPGPPPQQQQAMLTYMNT